MADWFYGKDNTQHGPVSEADIQHLLTCGEIDTNTIVWREGMADWIALKDVPEFTNLSAPVGENSPYATPQTNAGLPAYSGPVIPTDGLSIASLVCGILAVVTCMYGGLCGLPAVICGHMALKKINNSPTPIQGKGMAIAGLVCGYLGILMTVCMIGFFAFAFTAGASSGGYSP